MPKLQQLSAEGRVEREIDLHDLGDITIGRAPQCEVYLQDPLVLRRHAWMARTTEGAHIISALEGAQGVRLNDAPVNAPTPLRGGDSLLIGRTRLLYLDEPWLEAPEVSAGVKAERAEHKPLRASGISALRAARAELGALEQLSLRCPISSSARPKIRDLAPEVVLDGRED